MECMAPFSTSFRSGFSSPPHLAIFALLPSAEVGSFGATAAVKFRILKKTCRHVLGPLAVRGEVALASHSPIQVPAIWTTPGAMAHASAVIPGTLPRAVQALGLQFEEPLE